MSTLHILYDADSALFTVEMAMENGGYLVGTQLFKNKKLAKEFCEKNGVDLSAIEQVKNEPEFDKIYYFVKKYLTKKAELAFKAFTKTTPSVKNAEVFFFLTGSINFRKQLTDTYKANRINAPRPPYLKQLKEALVKDWQAILIDGLEADDVIAQYKEELDNKKEKSIILSIDKDLNTIPGNHFNVRKNDLYHLSHLNAEYNFFTQLLIGDPGDNVKGVGRVGPETAKKILAGKKTREERWNAVKEVWKEKHPEEWKEKLSLCANLIFLRRSPEQGPFDYYNLEI